MRTGRGGGLVALALAVAVVAIPAVGAASGTASPAPAVDGTIDGGAVIRASLAAFDGISSYRYEHRGVEDVASGMERVTTGTIVDGEPFRSKRSVSAGGETGWVRIQVGGEAWRSLYGSGFALQADGADPHPGPLDAWAASLMDAADAGVRFGPPVADTVDGVAVLRYAGTTAPVDPAASPDPDGNRPRNAQVELIVEAATGRLVEATVATQQADRLPLPGPPTIRSSLQHFRVFGVDDPANAVEAPPVGPNPSAPPSGDPALEPVVLAALDGLAAAGAWRSDTETLSLGGRFGEGRIVVTSPESAVEAWTVSAGRRAAGIRAFADGFWQTFGEGGPWVAVDPAVSTCFGGACDLAGLREVGRGLRPIAATFAELAPETLDGVTVRHLRSEAGMVGADGPIPGATDLWIDAATGLPVRVRFDGLGILSDTRYSRVGDSSLTVERPDA